MLTPHDLLIEKTYLLFKVQKIKKLVVKIKTSYNLNS